MKNLINIFLIIVIGSACQPPVEKQYFTESPEIDMVRQGITAYLAQDWDSFKQMYADTAQIYQNNWDKSMTIDESIENFKQQNADLTDINFTGPEEGNGVYEMVVTDNGNKWVHFWGKWSAKLAANGQEVSSLVNVSFNFQGGKIAMEVGIYDNLPIYQAMGALVASDSSEVTE